MCKISNKVKLTINNSNNNNSKQYMNYHKLKNFIKKNLIC